MTSEGVHCRPRRRRQGTSMRAFTLLELMLAVMIVAMLMTIAVPAISALTAEANTAKSKAIVRSLDNACQAFRDDFDAYPPSNEGGSYSGWLGAQLLPMFLTGFASDMANDGVAGGDLPAVLAAHVLTPPGNSNTFDEDDGVSDYGFRLVPRGRIYGPYFGAENMKLGRLDPGDRPVFVDAFGNTIFYYAATGGQYVGAHNNTLDDATTGPLSASDDYARDGSGDYYRLGDPAIGDVILASKGADGKFVKYTDAPDTDDITNFLPED